MRAAHQNNLFLRGTPPRRAARWVSPLALCLLAAGGPASAQIAFEAQTAMSTGASPSAVAVGDFNGDGDQDIAVTVESNNRVYIYNGHGDGTFSFAVSYPVGMQPVAITAVDLNHDGKLDLAVANRQSGTVSILIGQGDSSFATAIGYGVGALPVSIAAASYDPDGFVDLVTANRGNVCAPPFNPCGTVSLLRNNGDGTFYAGATLYPGVVPDTIAAGIFTTGGDADFVVTSFASNDFLVYLGDGGGNFPTVKGPFTTLGASVVLVDDFDRDGNADIAISRADSGDISMQRGNGDGTFAAAGIYSEGAVTAHPYSGATADFDGDDHADIAFANYTDNSIAVLRTRTVGNGGFDTALTFSGGLNGPSSIASADFNHDGKPDLVVVNSGGDSVTVFLNRSIPTDRLFMDDFDFN